MGRYRLHYNSRLRVGPLEPAKLEPNLRVLEKLLLESAPARSLAFLIDDRGGRTFASAFEKELARRLSAGVARLAHGDLEGGASEIRGLGYGLTPSGDDFLAGFLLGMHALEMAAGIDLARSATLSARPRAAPTRSPRLCCARPRKAGVSSGPSRSFKPYSMTRRRMWNGTRGASSRWARAPAPIWGWACFSR
jgi:hypothetical protein